MYAQPLSRFLVLAAALLSACGGGDPGPTPDGGTTPTDHRPMAVSCPANDTLPLKACTVDADCSPTPVPGSYCAKTASGSFCKVDHCLTDSDCGATGVCSCKGKTRGYAGSSPGNVCVPSNCRTDSDCAGAYCSPTVDSGCGSFYGTRGYYCHTPQDTCHSDSDCKMGGLSGYCAYQPEMGHWSCGYAFCAG